MEKEELEQNFLFDFVGCDCEKNLGLAMPSLCKKLVCMIVFLLSLRCFRVCENFVVLRINVIVCNSSDLFVTFDDKELLP